MDVNVNLVKESKIVHQQCRSTRSPSARLFRVLDRLVAGKRNVRQTLRAASHDPDFVIRICALTLVISSVSNNWYVFVDSSAHYSLYRIYRTSDDTCAPLLITLLELGI